MIVGHVPLTLSRAFHLFLKLTEVKSQSKSEGKEKNKGIGLEIPAIYRFEHEKPSKVSELVSPGGSTLGISGWGCAARTLEPLAYTRASFSWILLPYTRVNS